jgi:hypothetical protein
LFRLHRLKLDPAPSGFTNRICKAVVAERFSEAGPRAELSATVCGWVLVIARAPGPDRPYGPSRHSRGRGPEGCGVVDLDPRLRFSRRTIDTRSCCRPAWTPADLGCPCAALGTLFLAWAIKEGFAALAFFAFAYGVCYGATIALRPAVIADHFGGPNLAAVTGLHYTSSVLGPLVGPAAFGYSVDFWNSDLVASCVAAACLVAAGYFFAAKPPQIGLRRAAICRPWLRPTRVRGFTTFRPLTLPTA